MKQTVEKRKPSGIVDYIALALTTWGVGYGPIAPGTWGSAVGVLIYIGIAKLVTEILAHFSMFATPVWPFLAEYPTTGLPMQVTACIYAGIAVSLCLFCLIGIWASGRTAPIFGNSDPSEAVVDEVMGQLVTFCFIPFGLSWPFILAGFLLFRLFDIWKPFPVRNLEVLPGGLGICADDIVAGVYAGICLAVVYAVFLAV
jgi:phosphatidylglycerophosphatase A